MTPILTVTLNPALDLSASCPVVEHGPKLRLSDVQTEPGGGGVNVSRAIALLGGTSRALVAWAGATGARHRALLEAALPDLVALPLEGETRESLTVNDADGHQFRFVLPGPDWPPDQEDRALDTIVGAAGGAGPVVLSGSQPPGVGADFPARLAARLGRGRLIVDTSGAALEHLVRAPAPAAAPWVLRMDQAESEALAGGRLEDVAASARLARRLVSEGVAEVVILARGADGSVLADRDTALHCRPPEVAVQSKVGAGDSFTGALALALARGAGFDSALAQGTAAAAAAVMTPGSALCRADTVARLLPDCVVRRLDPPSAGAQHDPAPGPAPGGA